MRNVTALLLRYLDAKQHLWNSFFLEKVHNIYDCEPLESFDVIDERLFFALVCHPLKLTFPSGYRVGKDPFRSIVVKPKKGTFDISITISRDSKDGNRYWELPVLAPSKKLSMSFIEFFQWNKYDFLSCSLVRCTIETISNDRQDVGKEVLVEWHMIDFFVH